MNSTRQIDFCITTVKRPHALKRLLLSIVKYYPSAHIHIADQNEIFDQDFYEKLTRDFAFTDFTGYFNVNHLPYDCGISYARNNLVVSTPNRYKLILDDDMVFSERTDIAKFVELLEANPSAGVIGGLITRLGQEKHFESGLERRGDTLWMVPDENPYRNHNGIRFRKTDCIFNFALFRKDVFSHIQWDPEQKLSEHLDFYWRMKKVPIDVLYTPDVAIDHPPTESANEYKNLRWRSTYHVRMMRKHGFTEIRYINGGFKKLLSDGLLERHYTENGPEFLENKGRE